MSSPTSSDLSFPSSPRVTASTVSTDTRHATVSLDFDTPCLSFPASAQWCRDTAAALLDVADSLDNAAGDVPYSYESVRAQVGDMIVTDSDLPAAWWIGTAETLAMRDQFYAAEEAEKEAIAELARGIDAHETKVWRTGRSLTGFTPLDLENPHKALRESPRTPGMWIPNRRTKVGKELHAALEAHNLHRAVRPSQHFTGYSGVVLTVDAAGQHWMCEHSLLIHPDRPVLLTLAADPDTEGSTATVDPDLWHRLPLSWLVRLREELPAAAE